MYAQSDPESVSTIVIAGCGYAGMSLAIRLMRHARGHMNVYIVEPGNIGGVAYSEETADEGHYQNLQAGRLSLLREDPDHFMRWAKLVKKLDFDKSDPVSRAIQGEYCWDLMWQESMKCPYATLQVCKGTVASFHEEDACVSIRPLGNVTLLMSNELLGENDPLQMWQVMRGMQTMPLTIEASGQPITLPTECNYLVGATGHLEVKKPKALEHIQENGNGVIIDQYTSSAYQMMDAFVANVKESDTVLIEGTGLSAYDAAVSIVRRCRERNKPIPNFIFNSHHAYRHPIYAQDHSHKALKPPPRPAILDQEHITLTEVKEAFPVIWAQATESLMAQDAEALCKNPDLLPERALKAMEPYVAELIQKMSPENVRAAHKEYWSLITANRIGVVPKIGKIILDLERQGKAQFIAGPLTAFSDGHAMIETQSGVRGLDIQLTINSIGRSFDYTETSNPFWLYNDFLPHQKTGLGVAVTEDGNLVHRDGTPYKRVFCCGTMHAGDEIERRGRLGAFTTSQGPIKAQTVHVANIINRGISQPFDIVNDFYEFAREHGTTDMEAFFRHKLEQPLSPGFGPALREMRESRLFDVGHPVLYAETVFSKPPSVAMAEREANVMAWLDDLSGLQGLWDRHRITNLNEKWGIQFAAYILLELGVDQAMRACSDITTDPQTVIQQTIAHSGLHL